MSENENEPATNTVSTSQEPKDSSSTGPKPGKMEVMKSNDQSTDEKENKKQKEEEEPQEMVEIPKKRLEELENAEEIALETIKRERAESINYRKRLQKQRDEFADIASARVLTKLLAVQDDLKRILDNGAEEIPQEHLEGIELLGQRIKGIFESENVSLMDIEEGKTKYDPRYHEAIVTQPIPGVADNTIVQVVTSGFQKADRVLRPAKVIIAKSPPKETKDKEKEKADSQKDLDSSQDDEPTDETSETQKQ